MERSVRDFQEIIYILISAVSLIFFVISTNDLLVHNVILIHAGLTLSVGGWIYWIFTVSLIFTFVFLYMFFKTISNLRKFARLINSPSKQTFVKNLVDLEKLAQSLGSVERKALDAAKDRWKVR